MLTDFSIKRWTACTTCPLQCRARCRNPPNDGWFQGLPHCILGGLRAAVMRAFAPLVSGRWLSSRIDGPPCRSPAARHHIAKRSCFGRQTLARHVDEAETRDHCSLAGGFGERCRAHQWRPRRVDAATEIALHQVLRTDRSRNRGIRGEGATTRICKPALRRDRARLNHIRAAEHPTERPGPPHLPGEAGSRTCGVTLAPTCARS